MTKELPGLGSAALRELGLKINKAREHLKEVTAKYNSDVDAAGDMGSVSHIGQWSVRRAEDELHSLQQEAWKAVAEFALLSLSSPIEPPPACSCNDSSNEDGCPIHGEFYASNMGTQASSEVREALEQAAQEASNIIEDLGDAHSYQEVRDHVAGVILALKPRNEMREIRNLAEVIVRETHNCSTSHCQINTHCFENQAKETEKWQQRIPAALAPSRQGAAKRVEG